MSGDFYDLFKKDIPPPAGNRWDALWATPEPSPPGSSLTAATPGTATSYAAAALRSEAATVAAAPEGTRNQTLNKSFFNMGRHVGAGNIDAETVRNTLAQAARAAGLPQQEIDTVLRDTATSGLNQGQAHPRHPAALPEVPGVTVLDAAGVAHVVLSASWQPQDLTDVVRGLQDGTLTRPEPTLGHFGDGCALFYPGRVNGIHGDSNAGKTWTALAASAQEIRLGHTVVYIDLEDDAAGVVSRLLDLGAASADIVARFVYIGPCERLDAVARDLLAGLLAERSPSLVVIDSTGEGLALDGANPNADEEVARWFRSLPRWVADRGPGVLVLDHMAKADDGSLWPIGSQRKRAAIDGAQYAQRVVRPFSRDTAGVAVLICAKDRGGNYRANQRVAELRVTPNGDGVTVDLVAAQDDHGSTGGAFRPTVLMERVSRALEVAGAPLTFNGIVERVKGKRVHVRTATDVLLAEGHVSTTAGANRATLHTSSKPFREVDDAGEPLGPESESSSGSGGSGSLGGEPGNHRDGWFREPPGNHRESPAFADACTVCGEALHPVLSAAGETTHPSCGEA